MPSAIPATGTAGKGPRRVQNTGASAAGCELSLGQAGGLPKHKVQFRALMLNRWSEASSLPAGAEKRWLRSLVWEQLI